MNIKKLKEAIAAVIPEVAEDWNTVCLLYTSDAADE